MKVASRRGQKQQVNVVMETWVDVRMSSGPGAALGVRAATRGRRARASDTENERKLKRAKKRPRK